MIDTSLLKQKVAQAEQRAFERYCEPDVSEEILNILTDGDSEQILLALCDGNVTLHELEKTIIYHRLRDMVERAEGFLNLGARGGEMIWFGDRPETTEETIERHKRFIKALEKYNLVTISFNLVDGFQQAQIRLSESDTRPTKEEIKKLIFPYQEIQFREYGSDELLTGLVVNGARRDPKGKFDDGGRYSVENIQNRERYTVPYYAILLDSLLNNAEESRVLAARRIVFAGGNAVRFDISHDDRFLVTCGGDIRLWDIVTGHCLRVYDDGLTTAQTVQFSADGELFITGSRDAPLRLWDAFSGECIHIFKGHTDGVACVRFCFEDQYVISSSSKTLRLWDIESGEIIRVFEGHTAAVRAIAGTSDSEEFFSCSGDGTIRKWNIHSGECLQVMQYGEKPFDDLGIYPEGQIGESSLNDLAIFPQGHLLVSAAGNKKFNIWNAETGESIRSMGGHRGQVNSVDISKDGQFVVSASVDEKSIRVWDLSKENSFFELTGHERMVVYVKFSKSGRFLVSASSDHTLRLWDTETWECLRTIGQREVLDLTSIT